MVAPNSASVIRLSELLYDWTTLRAVFPDPFFLDLCKLLRYIRLDPLPPAVVGSKVVLVDCIISVLHIVSIDVSAQEAEVTLAQFALNVIAARLFLNRYVALRARLAVVQLEDVVHLIDLAAWFGCETVYILLRYQVHSKDLRTFCAQA